MAWPDVISLDDFFVFFTDQP